MSVWNAIGLMVFILVLKWLVPAVLTQGISTTLAFLHGAEVSANAASSYVAASSALNSPALPLYPLPQATQITR